jgi:hypothetical protein
MHGMLDYPAGILLLAAPWIFGFTDVNSAQAVAMIVGAVIILQSLITDYELSVANVLPLPGHLALDVVADLFLALSPFIFGFSDEGANAWVPHLVAGLGLIAAGLMTQRHRETPRHGRGLPTEERHGRTGDRVRPSSRSGIR